MSLTRLAHAARRHILPVVFLSGLALVLPSCSSGGGDDGTGPGLIETVLELLLETGENVRGAQVDVSFHSSMNVVSVQPMGELRGQTCEANIQSNFVRLLCAGDDSVDFDAPATLWRITFEHDGLDMAQQLILSVDCLVSDVEGVTTPEDCSLS